MPKIAKELSALAVRNLAHPGDVSRPVNFTVGGVPGLMLQVTAGGGRSWLLRYTAYGKRNEMGLGPYPAVGLAEAREAARKAHAEVREGGDPVATRKARAAAVAAERARNLTFAQAVKRYAAEKLDATVICCAKDDLWSVQ